jgi:hypothetical protein
VPSPISYILNDPRPGSCFCFPLSFLMHIMADLIYCRPCSAFSVFFFGYAIWSASMHVTLFTFIPVLFCILYGFTGNFDCLIVSRTFAWTSEGLSMILGPCFKSDTRGARLSPPGSRLCTFQVSFETSSQLHCSCLSSPVGLFCMYLA